MKLFKVCSTAIIVLLLSSVVLTGCGGGGSSAAPPAAPTGVTATPGNGQVTIAWTAVPGATSYNIYWSTTAGVTPANATNKASGATSFHLVTTLTNNTTYYFVVTAVRGSAESAASAQVSTVPTATPPAAPTGVTATPGNGQVTIAWTQVPGATSYNIYWSTTAGVIPNAIGVTKITGATNPSTVTGLTNGITHFFAVTAVNGNGESTLSAEVNALPSAAVPPAAPTGVTATPGNGQITITWTAVPGATSYNIYWAATPGVTPNSTGVTKITGATSPYTLTSLTNGITNGTIYFFVVTAVNGNGESTLSAEVSALASATPGGAPFIQATVLSLPGVGNPLSWLQHVDVFTDGTLTTPIINAAVIVNGTTLTFDAVRGTYNTVTTSAIAPGAPVTVSVTIGSATYTATGTEYTLFPILTAPTGEVPLLAANANTFTWTAGAPTAGATYLFGLVDEITSKITFPAGNVGLQPVGTTSFTLPANSVPAGSAAYVFLGIATAGIGTGIGNNTGGIPFASTPATAPRSGLWLGQLTAYSPVDFN